MTNNAIAAHVATHCIDCNDKLTRKNNAHYVIECDRADLCVYCYDPSIERPTTKPEAVATGRTNRSHATCSHPRTPAGRAACRKANA